MKPMYPSSLPTRFGMSSGLIEPSGKRAPVKFNVNRCRLALINDNYLSGFRGVVITNVETIGIAVGWVEWEERAGIVRRAIRVKDKSRLREKIESECD